jgi:YD repeat-containing protein
MKKLGIFLMTLVFGLYNVHGQTLKEEKTQIKETKKELKSERVALRKLEGTIASEQARSNFAFDFSNAKDAQWKRVDTFDEVTFTNADGQKMTAYYDYDAKLVGTTQTKKLADIPVKGQEAIKKMYKDYSPGAVIYFNDNEANSSDMILWATQFDDEDLYFVELTKGTNKIVAKVNPAGIVSFFKQL